MEELLDYYPFGSIRLDQKAGAFSQRRKFTGQEYDADTGLSYMNARYQTGALGRFISQDPVFWAVGDEGKLKDKTGLTLSQYLENPQGFNSYSYAFNNPLKYQDNRGEFAFLAPLAYYAVATAPTWVPAAITWTAAATLAITAPLVGGAAASYYQGDVRSGDAMINGAMITNGFCAAGVSGVMAVANNLSDAALVCRGGGCSASQFKNATGASLDASGKLRGVSVNSAPGASLEQLTKSLPHNQVGVTTVGDVRKLGGDVLPSPSLNGANPNPFHSTLQGITPQQAEGLFKPTISNPSKVK